MFVSVLLVGLSTSTPRSAEKGLSVETAPGSFDPGSRESEKAGDSTSNDEGTSVLRSGGSIELGDGKGLGQPLANACPYDIVDWVMLGVNWPLASVQIGSSSYTRSVLEDFFYNDAFDQDDPSMILAGEIVAAKLNRAAGLDWAPVELLLADADAAIGASPLPQQLNPSSSSAIDMLAIAGTLEEFNTGDHHPVCVPSVVTRKSPKPPNCPWTWEQWEATPEAWPEHLRVVVASSGEVGEKAPEQVYEDGAVREEGDLRYLDGGEESSKAVIGDEEQSSGETKTETRESEVLSVSRFDDGLSRLADEVLAARLNIDRGAGDVELEDLVDQATEILDRSIAPEDVACGESSLDIVKTLASLEARNAGLTRRDCLGEGSSTKNMERMHAAVARQHETRCGARKRRSTIHGIAELHTHMLAEFGWNGNFISGTMDDLTTQAPETEAEAMPNCSGDVDHASMFYPNLALTSENLTAVGGMAAFLGFGNSTGDTGLHRNKTNGFDTETCDFACTGAPTCLPEDNEADCLARDAAFCTDGIANNISAAATVACNLEGNENDCQASGYCGARNSSFWSVADDVNPCWANWPNCDAGDMCVKRNPLKSLTCSDLNQADCATYDDECDWQAQCKHDNGSLTCSDLNQGDCNQYSTWCGWDPGSCSKDPAMALVPFGCTDLTQNDCGTYSECDWETECRHVSGSLECNDLNQQECQTYNECSWLGFLGCKNNVVNGSLTCSDLTQAHCGNHTECAWGGECEHDNGSLTCGDLNAGDCAQYTNWCDWDAASCSKHLWQLAPFECNDLTQNDCGTYNECRWDEKCIHPPLAPALQCSDLDVNDCTRYFNSGGCDVRDCTAVMCEWQDAGDCNWDAVWPPHCGEHFRDWPSWDTPTHQQHWWGHLRDAYRKDLRIVSASILEVDPLLVTLPGGEARTPYEVIIAQLEAANEFDALHDWITIALSPEHARRIIDAGQLALVLTLEANFPFCDARPCDLDPANMTMAQIRPILQEYWDLGLRSMQVVSHFDNNFGGVAAYTAGIHAIEWLYRTMNEDGDITYQEMLAGMDESEADTVAQVDQTLLDINIFSSSNSVGPVQNQFPVNGFDELTDIHALLALMGKASAPQCVRRDNGLPENCIRCLADEIPCQNVLGLTPIGRDLVRELIDMGMLIDIAHISDTGAQEIYTITQQHAPNGEYPLYISHGDPREMLPASGHKGSFQEKPSPPAILNIVRDTGGMFGQRPGPDHYLDHPDSNVDNDCHGTSKSFAQPLAYLVDYGLNVGIALDMNGMVPTSAPRFVDWSTRQSKRRGRKAACLGDINDQFWQQGEVVDDPITPFVDESEYNTKGLAHIGQLGAFMDDLDNVGLGSVYVDNLYMSAENFVRMWELVP